MKLEIEISEHVEQIIREFCREHIGYCDSYIDELGEKMPLPPYLKKDLTDTLQHRRALVEVYNYCSVERWEDEDE